MATATFDTLQYANRLTKGGFTREQAEAQAEALREVIEEQATKLDMIANDNNLATKHDLQVGLAQTRSELEIKMERVRLDVIRWVIGSIVGLAALMIAIQGLIIDIVLHQH